MKNLKIYISFMRLFILFAISVSIYLLINIKNSNRDFHYLLENFPFVYSKLLNIIDPLSVFTAKKIVYNSAFFIYYKSQVILFRWLIFIMILLIIFLVVGFILYKNIKDVNNIINQYYNKCFNKNMKEKHVNFFNRTLKYLLYLRIIIFPIVLFIRYLVYINYSNLPNGLEKCSAFLLSRGILLGKFGFSFLEHGQIIDNCDTLIIEKVVYNTPSIENTPRITDHEICYGWQKFSDSCSTCQRKRAFLRECEETSPSVVEPPRIRFELPKYKPGDPIRIRVTTEIKQYYYNINLYERFIPSERSDHGTIAFESELRANYEGVGQLPYRPSREIVTRWLTTSEKDYGTELTNVYSNAKRKIDRINRDIERDRVMINTYVREIKIKLSKPIIIKTTIEGPSNLNNDVDDM